MSDPVEVDSRLIALFRAVINTMDALGKNMRAPVDDFVAMAKEHGGAASFTLSRQSEGSRQRITLRITPSTKPGVTPIDLERAWHVIEEALEHEGKVVAYNASCTLGAGEIKVEFTVPPLG